MRSRKDDPSATYLWSEIVFDTLGAMLAARAADELRLDVQALYPDSHAAAVAEAFSAGLDPEIGIELARVLRLDHGDDDCTESFIRLAHLVRALLGSQSAAIETGLAILRLDADAIKELGIEIDRRMQVRTAVGWILLGIRNLGSDSLACSEDWPAVARDLGNDFVQPLSEGQQLIIQRALIERIRAQGFDKVAGEIEGACRRIADKSSSEWRRGYMKAAADNARANRERAEKALAGEVHEGYDDDELWLHAALADRPPAVADLVEALDTLVRQMFPNTPAADHAAAALRCLTEFEDNKKCKGNLCALVLALLNEVGKHDAGPAYAIESLAVLVAARLGDRPAAASVARHIRSVSDHVTGDDALQSRMRAVAEAWRVLGADPEAALAEETDLGDAAIRIAGETRTPEPIDGNDEAFWLTAALDPNPPSIKDLVEELSRCLVKAMPDTEAARWAEAASDAIHFSTNRRPDHVLVDIRLFVRLIIDECSLVLRTSVQDGYWLAHLVHARLGNQESAAELARELIRVSREIGVRNIRNLDPDDQNRRRRVHLVAHGWLVLSADQSAADLGTTDYGNAALENGYGVMSMFETNVLDRLDAARRRTAERKAAEPETLIVLKSVAAAPKNHGRTASAGDTYGDFDGLILRPLPLVHVPDIAAVKGELAAEFPHAEGLIESILGDLVGRKSIRLRPTLLLGPPGGGKSRLARRLCESLSLPHLLYPAAGIGDAAFAGTARRWSSAEPSLPLRLLRDREVANPCLILDEIEKAGSSARNGRLWDALIPMLERETACRWEDPYVQSAVDLSAINWICTANSLDGLPSPLLDRMRVLRMPSPTAEHLPVLATSLLRELARERGLDPRWLQPLAAFEIEGLQNAWKSGSVRGLRRLLEGVLEARDMSAPRN